MLSLYRPGNGWMHRMPTGPKLAGLAAVALVLAALPSTWVSAAVALGAACALFLLSGVRAGELPRQIWALRWIIVVTAAGQLLFLGPEAAAANTARVVAALLVAGLVPLTTPVAAMLDALERGLGPLRRIGVDPARVALLWTVALTTIPVLARLAGEVSDALRVRGLRPSLWRGALPFVILALRHADDLGDALAARGIR